MIIGICNVLIGHTKLNQHGNNHNFIADKILFTTKSTSSCCTCMHLHIMSFMRTSHSPSTLEDTSYTELWPLVRKMDPILGTKDSESTGMGPGFWSHTRLDMVQTGPLNFPFIMTTHHLDGWFALGNLWSELELIFFFCLLLIWTYKLWLISNFV